MLIFENRYDFKNSRPRRHRRDEIGAKSAILHSSAMHTRRSRSDLRDRHAAEIEANQAALRASISETERLVGETETILTRHRQENDDADANGGTS